MSELPPVITVVGSFAVGMTIRAPHFPVAGETLRGSDFDLGPGGKGSNQAVGVARLGAQSHLVAKVGKDRFADIAVDLYQREHVNFDYLFRTESRPTGVGFITLNAAGENHIILDMGANETLSPSDVDAAEALIARSQVVMTVLEIQQETAVRAMELGHKNGALTIMNPAPAEWLDPSIFCNIDVLTPNESELRILSGLSPDDLTDTLFLAKRLQGQGIKNVVVTLGSRGALVLEAGKSEQLVPGISVQVTDTTGAGDAFNAALGFALANKKSLLKAVQFATVGGALACTKLGVIPALPHLDEIEAFIRLSRLS
jgi:ribokinase